MYGEHGDITIHEINEATNTILKHVQRERFPDEITNLKKGLPVKKKSSIAALNPVLVNGLIRMKGRHDTGSTTGSPIVIPHDRHLTTLIVRYYHVTQGHVGAQQVLASIRQRYWIIRGPSTVKRTAQLVTQSSMKNQKCELCHKLELHTYVFFTRLLRETSRSVVRYTRMFNLSGHLHLLYSRMCLSIKT